MKIAPLLVAAGRLWPRRRFSPGRLPQRAVPRLASKRGALERNVLHRSVVEAFTVPRVEWRSVHVCSSLLYVLTFTLGRPTRVAVNRLQRNAPSAPLRVRQGGATNSRVDLETARFSGLKDA